MKNDLGALTLVALVAKQLADLKASFATLSRQHGPTGPQGDRGSIGLPGPTGLAGVPGASGQDGADGIDGMRGDKGDTGEAGPIPKHEWKGTKLRFEKPDGEWGKLVDLKGADGKNGSSGGVTYAAEPGSSFDPSGLPQAGDNLPSEFIVKQGGVWVRASYAQVQGWVVPANVVTVTVGG